MEFLVWIEDSSVAEWARISLWGYPITITAHSIGLAIMVGAALVLDLRVLGLFRSVPYRSFSRVLGIAWIGFAVNFLSGVVLFSMQATFYVSNTLFLTKISFVFLGAISAAVLQRAVSRHSDTWGVAAVPGSLKLLAIASLILWLGAIVSGRLIAYLG